MKRQILISLLILLFVAGFSRAVNPPGTNLPDLVYYNLSEDDFTAYKEGELLVRFAEVEAGAQLPEGLLKPMGPLTTQAIRNSISDYIFTGAVIDREYDEIAPGLAVVKLPEGMSVADACIQFNQSANVLYAEPTTSTSCLLFQTTLCFPICGGLTTPAKPVEQRMPTLMRPRPGTFRPAALRSS